MTFNKRTIGADKEQLAAEYLIDNGYTVLERNFRSKDNYLVFIEVKYRSSTRYGAAVEAVNYKKQQTIRKVASYYLATRYRSCDIPCRFDVLGIDGRTIPHIKNAF